MDNGAQSYRRFLDGDESAFDDIMDEYHDNLIYFINSYVKNISQAEDLAMDTFVQILIHKTRYKFKSTFKTYLFAIAKNIAVDYIRKNKKVILCSDDNAFDSGNDIASLEESIIKTEEQQILKKVVGRLNDDYRRVIQLLYFDNLSYDEAAEILGKTKKQIDNIAYRSKLILKEELEKEGIRNLYD